MAMVILGHQKTESIFNYLIRTRVTGGSIYQFWGVRISTPIVKLGVSEYQNPIKNGAVRLVKMDLEYRLALISPKFVDLLIIDRALS